MSMGVLKLGSDNTLLGNVMGRHAFSGQNNNGARVVELYNFNFHHFIIEAHCSRHKISWFLV